MTDTLFTSQIPGGTFNNVGGETLGVAFYAVVPGTVDGFRIYGPSTPPLILPTCGLWRPTSASTGGSPLGTVQFGAPPTSGVWNTVMLSSPVSISANVLYRATEYTDFYVATSAFWAAPLSSGSLRGIQDATDPTSAGWSVRNGTFANSTTLGAYPPDQPGNTFNAGCYFIDVIFTPAGGAQDADAALTATASLAATAAAARAGTAGLTVTGSMTGTAAVARASNAALVATATAAATASKLAAAGSGLSVAAVLTASASVSPAGGSIIPRPDTGRVSRPSAGSVARPFTGIIRRP